MSIVEPPRFTLELASGRNEITAPFRDKASRTVQRKLPEPARTAEPGAIPVLAVEPSRIAEAQPFVEAAAVLPAITPVRAPPIEPVAAADRKVPRPTWPLFAIALLVVATATWWIMQQRMPDIDPQQVIAKNLSAARQAMAEGRYVDPPEHSALHHYSTVLALNPASDEAREGIDAIAERYLSEARMMLDDGRIAEAGVALDRARRARPDHRNLAALDARMRAELNKLLASAADVPAPSTVESRRALEPAAKPAPVTQPAPAAIRVAKTTPAATAPERPTSNVAREPRNETVAANRSRELQAQPPAGTDHTTVAAAANSTGSVSAPTPVPTMTIADTAPATGTAASSPTATSSPAASGSAPVVAQSAPPDAAPVAAPKLIKLVKPDYPQDARMRGLEGWVDISIRVTAAGDVVDPRVEESNRGRMFNRAALVAVQRWKYAPRSNEIAQSEERLRVRLEFRLSD